jgi:TnpA family transposase
VFHGKRGELRQRYREGQEDQLGALGLVVNIIVLWNTRYMTAAVDRLKHSGYRGSVVTFDPRAYQHARTIFVRSA